MKSNENSIRMWTPQTAGLVVFMLLGLVAVLYRMTLGLGAATNLNDNYPWGFWLAFDVLGGEAMATGGLIISCAVYLFNWEKYRPIIRPAALTALLGYIMAIVALFLDMGHPFRLWHPTVMWQAHSVLWIVAILVMLYIIILAIESSPMLFEKLHWERAGKSVKSTYIVVVVFGVMLAALHQASLGAIFLIAPAKMSPLWFNDFLPYLFLLSAVAMGLAMVSTEAVLAGKAFGHKVDMEIFRGLARGMRNTLAIYFLLKFFLLLKNTGIGAAFGGSLEANMYLLEMAFVLVPLGMLLCKNISTDKTGILSVNLLVIVGVLVNRLNVAIFSMQDYTVSQGEQYFPSIIEFLVTLGIISLGIFLFKMAAKFLPLFASTETEGG